MKFLVSRRNIQTTLSMGLCSLFACSEAPQIETTLINPCNQVGLDQVDFLRFEPRGTGIDSQGLSSIQTTDAKQSQGLVLPLVEDFSLLVTGHVGSHENPIAGIGWSIPNDTTTAREILSVKIPFALVDQFYRTTDLANPINCTEMRVARTGASATYLPANKKVLIVGGETIGDGLIEYRRSIEFYDPATGQFEIIGELRAGAQRAFHTATLLDDQRVLITGGEAITNASKEALASALVISITPEGRAVSEVIRMPEPRTGHQAVKLADGRVVLIGGRVLVASGPPDETRHTYISKLAVFDPTSNGFLSFGSEGLLGPEETSNARFGHSATLLASGRDILIAGGYNKNGVVREFEMLSFAENQVAVSAPNNGQTQAAVGPIFHSATLMPSGQVMFAGGYDSVAEAAPQGPRPINSSRKVEIWEYNATQNSVLKLCSDDMQEERGFHTASVVGSQAYFIGGRLSDGIPTNHTEVVGLKDLTGGATSSCFSGPSRIVTMSSPRAQHTVVDLPTGEIMIVGGKQHELGDDFGTSLATVDILSPFRQP